MEEYVCYC